MYEKSSRRIYTLFVILLIITLIVPVGGFSPNNDTQLLSNNNPNQDFSDPKVVRPNSIVDMNNDKIDDQLTALIQGDPDIEPKSLEAFRENGEKIKACICVDQKPDDALIKKLRGFGAEILRVYDDLIYAVYVVLPVDKINDLAAEDYVTFIEKEYYSTAHLDTSTVNFGARGSPYVWDATPSIKGNPHYSIAILDTGVDSTHSDMSNFLYFQDFSGGGYSSGITGYDYGHHGTHCASIAAGTGAGDTNPETVKQTYSNQFSDNVGWYYAHRFEVKHNTANPNTWIQMIWDNSGGGSVRLGVLDMNNVWVYSYIVSSGFTIGINVGNMNPGWYKVYCAPHSEEACGKDYTVQISHEYDYMLDDEPTNAPVFTGVAPQSNIISLKVLDDNGHGNSLMLLNAFTWISNNGKNPAYNITTVSMSLGFEDYVPTIDAAVNNLVDEGFICVASAGNDGTTSTMTSPGTAQKCITVGAVNDAFEVVYYSSNGDNIYYKPDVIAPGGTFATSGSNSLYNGIIASDSNNGDRYVDLFDPDPYPNDYLSFQGTSMACPHVAGLAQLAIDAIINTEGSWTWSQANALRVKQLICMGTWEVNAGETFDGDGDGIPQNPSLDRIGRDNVEGYGMVRADAVIQAIINITTSNMVNVPFYLNRGSGVNAKESKVFLFSINAEAGDTYNFTLDVPSTGDFDLIIYDKDFAPTTGRPVISTYSTNSGLDTDESLLFSPSESGIYYWSIRAVEGYGTCELSLNGFNIKPDAPTNPTPMNETTGVSTNPTLSVDVSDPNDHMMNISFYNTNNDSLIGTHFGVPSGGTASTLWSGLTEGTQYSWYAVASDGRLSTTSSTWSFTTFLDNPVWMQTPINQLVEFGESLTYDLNALDLSGIDHWWINDTIHFNIDSNGTITTTFSLPVGDYWLNVSVYDPYDNYCTASIKITVEDTTAPIWDELPGDQLVEFGENLGYDLSASDLSGIDLWMINDSSNFNINSNGFISTMSPLPVGDYWVNVSVFDPYGNYRNVIIKITVEDTTIPIWDQTPTDQSLKFGEELVYDVNASDLSGIHHWWISDLSNFSINSNGIITNMTTLSVGEYLLEVRAYDVYDNYCTITIIISIEPTGSDPPVFQIPGFNLCILLFLLFGISIFLVKKKIKFNF